VHPEISCLEVNGARKQLLTAGIKAETKNVKNNDDNNNNNNNNQPQ
jgi:hypothetical protein